MKVLLVIAVPHALEPVGAMSLCAICKQAGHEVDLAILKQEEGDLSRKLSKFQPDIVLTVNSSLVINQ